MPINRRGFIRKPPPPRPSPKSLTIRAGELRAMEMEQAQGVLVSLRIAATRENVKLFLKGDGKPLPRLHEDLFDNVEAASASGNKRTVRPPPKRV